MFFKIFFILGLFSSFSVGNVIAQLEQSPDPPSLQPVLPKIVPPVTSVPQSGAVAAPNPNLNCSKHYLPAGCLCDTSSGQIKINCTCTEVYKKLVYLSNTFIKYNQKRECLIDYFPGCQPITLPEGVSQPCEKLKRVVPKLAGLVREGDFANFCAKDYKQKINLTAGTNPLNLTCQKGGDLSQALVYFLQ